MYIIVPMTTSIGCFTAGLPHGMNISESEALEFILHAVAKCLPRSYRALSHSRALKEIAAGRQPQPLRRKPGTELGEPPLAADAAADAGSGSEHSESDDDDDDQYSEDE